MGVLLSILLAAAPSPQALAILERHECHRCHQVEGLSPPPVARSCAGCHQDIASSRDDPERERSGRAEYGEAWDRFVARTSVLYRAIPPLENMERFRADWLRAFFRSPVDLRPRLRESMIRPNLTSEELDQLIQGWGARPADPAGEAPPREEVVQGERLFVEKGCPSCHAFGNRTFPGAPPREAEWLRIRALAPDLRHARARLRRAVLERQLADPSSVLANAQMPAYALDAAEVRALASFLLHGDVGAPARVTARPPPVRTSGAPRYEDVEQRVFRRICWHCHSNADFADGDGGPGNSGGFGFAAGGLSFASWEEVMSGSVGPDGRRRSILRAGASGAPVLLERLRLRVVENARDHVTPGADPMLGPTKGADAPRGMPLGLPALGEDDLALVERWVRAGTPAPGEAK